MYAMRGVQDAKALLDRVRRAIRLQQPITLTYVKDGGEVTIRTVEPWKVEISQERNVYMRTYDRETGEVRSIRLDRILFYSTHRSKRALVNEYEDVTP